MAEGGVRLRRATNADRPQIEALVFGVLAEYGLQPDPGNTDADLQDIEAAYQARGGMFDVLENAAGQIVGSVGLYPVDARACELRKMYLQRRYRGQGHGQRLLEHALECARARGFSRVTLETASGLREAAQLYLRYGFRKYQPEHLSSRCDEAYCLDLARAGPQKRRE